LGIVLSGKFFGLIFREEYGESSEIEGYSKGDVSCRQGEPKTASLAHPGGFGADFTAVGFDPGFGDGEADSRPLLFPASLPLEKSFEHLLKGST